MSLHGIDVSTWQPSNVTALVDYDFAIMKASEGLTPARKCDAQVQAVRDRGKLYGVYHFASVGSTPRKQAEFFVDTVEGYLGEAVLVLDLEGAALPAWGAKGALEWLRRVEELTGVKPLLYTFGAALGQLGAVAAAGYGLWVAHWNNRTSGSYSAPPAPMRGPWKTAVIHQYTDQGRLSGYADALDLNIFHGDADDWRALAGGEDDMPLTDDDYKAIARAVWTNESVVNGAKFGDMIRVSYDSVKPGEKGVRHDGDLTAMVRAVYESVKSGEEGVRTHGALTAFLHSTLGAMRIQDRDRDVMLGAMADTIKALSEQQGIDPDKVLDILDTRAGEWFAQHTVEVSIDGDEG